MSLLNGLHKRQKSIEGLKNVVIHTDVQIILSRCVAALLKEQNLLCDPALFLFQNNSFLNKRIGAAATVAQSVKHPGLSSLKRGATEPM